jgi:hypothetical protein
MVYRSLCVSLVAAVLACTDRPILDPTEGTGSSSSSTDTGDPPQPTTAPDATTTTTTTTPEATTDPSTGAEPTCGENDVNNAKASIPRVNVVFVLDKSGSMIAAEKGFWDHDGDDVTPRVTKWSSLQDSVASFLVRHDRTFNAGVSLFPSLAATSEYGANACRMSDELEVPISPMNSDAIVAAMPAKTAMDLKGAAPMRLGLSNAVGGFLDIDEDSPRHIILLTDGPANCVADAPDAKTLLETYDEALAGFVAEVTSIGITTHVVGLGVSNQTSGEVQDGDPDDTNAFTRLNELAVLGGDPQSGDLAYHTADELELRAALDAIAAQVLPCTVTIDPVIDLWPFVELVIDTTEYGRPIDDCATEDGWLWLDEAETQLQLCGAACEQFREVGELVVRYRCPND